MKELFGVTTAMVTPFERDGSVDLGAVRELTNMLIEKGVNGLYPCGTTGEMFRMSVQERKDTARAVIETAAGRVPVYIHCGAMNQEDTIELVRHAKETGADGAGVVTPVYFAASPRELVEYYVSVAESVEDFPIYLYNIPQMAGNDLTVPIVEQIVERCPNVKGIKYSYADVNRTLDYGKIMDGKFSVIHGSDRVFLAMMVLGAKGVVSGMSSAFPEVFVACYRAYKDGDLTEALRMQRICAGFCDALNNGSDLSYIKTALNLRGLKGGHVRAPQLDLEEEKIAGLRARLEELCAEAGISLILKS